MEKKTLSLLFMSTLLLLTSFSKADERIRRNKDYDRQCVVELKGSSDGTFLFKEKSHRIFARARSTVSDSGKSDAITPTVLYRTEAYELSRVLDAYSCIRRSSRNGRDHVQFSVKQTFALVRATTEGEKNSGAVRSVTIEATESKKITSVELPELDAFLSIDCRSKP